MTPSLTNWFIEVGMAHGQSTCCSIAAASFQAGPRVRSTAKMFDDMVRYTRVKSMDQLVSQLLPSSSEKACSQRAELPVMRDHR